MEFGQLHLFLSDRIPIGQFRMFASEDSEDLQLLHLFRLVRLRF
jgi:hypothetical protein